MHHKDVIAVNLTLSAERGLGSSHSEGELELRRWGGGVSISESVTETRQAEVQDGSAPGPN